MKKLKEGARKLGLDLTSEQLERFEAYYRELIAWNAKLNLTAIIEYDRAQLSHFLDSLTLLPLLPAEAGIRVIDVGTGAGLPGLPLKIARPDVRLTLLEATAKKAGFLNHLVATLGLDEISVITGRAEAIAREPEHREAFGVVLARAVAALPALAELTLPLCAVGGVFIAPKKGDIAAEVAAAARAIEVLGGQLREVRPVDLEDFHDDRCLVIIDKLRHTPEEYPRRSGMPVKRPIK